MGQHPNSLKNLEKGKENHREESQERKQAFLEVLATMWPNISKACEKIGLPRQTVYDWKAKDKQFEQKWHEIQEKKLDAVESNVFEVSLSRGGAGYAFPLLKAYRKDKYGDKVEHSGELSQITIVSHVRDGLNPPQEPEQAQDSVN